MKMWLVLAFVWPLLAVGGDLDEILLLNETAIGGQQNLAQVENVHIEIEISEPGFTVTGTYVATREGAMRIDIFADSQRVFSEGLDGDRAWQWSPNGGIEWQDEASVAALRHGIDLPDRFHSLRQMKQRGERVSLEGEVEYEGQRQWQVRVELADGFIRDYFLDQETGQVVRQRDTRAFHPAIDPTEVLVETRLAGELHVDGVRRSSQTENVDIGSGKWLGTTRVLAYQHNVELPSGFFEPQ